MRPRTWRGPPDAVRPVVRYGAWILSLVGHTPRCMRALQGRWGPLNEVLMRFSKSDSLSHERGSRTRRNPQCSLRVPDERSARTRSEFGTTGRT